MEKIIAGKAKGDSNYLCMFYVNKLLIKQLYFKTLKINKKILHENGAGNFQARNWRTESKGHKKSYPAGYRVASLQY
ncbi:hypothetical protein [Taibaiella koreensis]|uniref:hypothetical protein n=1 Tax=Taibaiella koreensis TaxID=1268548 RepID=UPI0013C34851|nr:hypothetical protein [Taibaiella koreensis]